MAALEQSSDVDHLPHQYKKTVVVTGFGPFGKHSVNPSWEAVRLLPETGIDKELNIHLVTEQIPVSYEDVVTRVPQLWESHKPVLVIHVGVSDQPGKLILEQVAQKSGYDKLDIFGQTPACYECCFGDSPLIRSTLDISLLNDEMNSMSEFIRTDVSQNAGGYLCEYAYYTSLSIDNSRSIFVHVPPLDRPYSAKQMAKGLADIIRCLLSQLRKNAAS